MNSAIIEWDAGGRRLHIRDVVSEADFHAVERIQAEAWGFSDLDVVPMSQLVAAKWAGGMVLGAFDEERMIGFAYGFPAYDEGKISIHSHMLAVRPDCRNLQAGFLLKLAQRRRALDVGVKEITWTFDPLQSLNAHLNFSKLGVISHRYMVNFYGEATSSPLHQGVGTDRLWVRWLLESKRVTDRIGRYELALQGAPQPGGRGVEGMTTAAPRVEGLAAADTDVDGLTAAGAGGWPLPPSNPATALLCPQGDGWLGVDIKGALPDSAECLIEIPDDIAGLKRSDHATARAWRDSIRRAFTVALGDGFVVTGFFKTEDGNKRRWFYRLSRHPDELPG